MLFEPLFVLPGESVAFEVPVAGDAAGWQVNLTSLGQTFSADAPVAPPVENPPPDNWQPVQVMFANNASLQQMAVSESPQVCGALAVALRWNFAEYAGETVRVELVDQGSSIVERAHDLVVLSVGMLPAYNPQPVYRIPIADDGFVSVPAPNISPCVTDRSGVFVTGTAIGPMDIVDSIVMAGAATSEAATYILTKQSENRDLETVPGE